MSPEDRASMRARAALDNAELAALERGTAALTDVGNAKRLVLHYGALVRHAEGTWYIWTGHSWATDRTSQIRLLAERSVGEFGELVTRMNAPEDDEEAVKRKNGALRFLRQSHDGARLNASVAHATSQPGVAVVREDFDARAWELNTPSGVVNLRTGKLAAHDPERMHAQIATADYQPGAKAPKWEEFVGRVLPDEEVRRYVQAALGRALVGEVMPGHEVLLLGFRAGTGKSTMMEEVAHVLGDYAEAAPPTLLKPASTANSGSTYDLAGLEGKRLVLAEETPVIDADKLKQLSSAAALSSRQIRQKQRVNPNRLALVLTGNREPRLDGTDQGLRRRVRQIPFEIEVSPHYIMGLKMDLRHHEGPGILAWLVAGCLASQRPGALAAPDAVEEATEALFETNNDFRQWLEACCETAFEHAGHTSSELHESYIEWCHANRRSAAFRSPKSSTWAQALQDVGGRRDRTKRGTVWRHIRLRVQYPPPGF